MRTTYYYLDVALLLLVALAVGAAIGLVGAMVQNHWLWHLWIGV